MTVTPICDECHVDVNDEPHKRGCPWGDDTDTGYEVAQDLWMET